MAFGYNACQLAMIFIHELVDTAIGLPQLPVPFLADFAGR
jgi:hypothetical protein